LNTNSHLIGSTYHEWWRPDASANSAALATKGIDLNEHKLPFRALFLFTFILLIAPQAWFPVLAPFRIALLTGVTALLAHSVNQLTKGQPVFKQDTGFWLVVSLLLWSIVAIPYSNWPGGSLSYLTETYSRTVMLFILLPNLVNTKEKLRAICIGMALMTIPLALTTLKSYLTGAGMELGRVSGYPAPLTTNPNDMALLLNIILPLAIALFFSSKRFLFKVLILGVIGLAVLAILATFSRGGFLTLGVIGLVYMWRLRKRPQRYWGPIMILVAICSYPILPADYKERISTIANLEEDDTGSAQERYSDIPIALGLIKDKPLVGSGIGMSGIAMDERRAEILWVEVHNVYLQYGVDMGIPGMILFVALMVTCINATRKVLRQKAMAQEYDSLYFITEALLISLIAFTVAGIFHPVAYQLFFYYIGGLALSVKYIFEMDQANKLELESDS